jgi:uncharacterized protein
MILDPDLARPGSAGWGGSRKEQAIELGVFLSLIVPSLILSLFAIGQGKLGFVITALAIIARDLALTGLVLFFIWRNGEPVARIGWTSRKGVKYAALGVLLFPLLFFGAAALESVFLHLGLSAPSKPRPSFLSFQGWIEVPLAVVLVIVVAVAEETIFRGYLILRFVGVGANVRTAALLSSVVFSLGHGYEGSAGLVTVGIMGLVFAVVYLRTGSLVAPMVMHFLQDFISVVVAPLIGNAH